MKRLAPILATAFLLAACGAQEQAPKATTESNTPTALPTPANEVKTLALGEEITITKCNGGKPCVVDITFDEFKLTETCPDGVEYQDMEPMDPTGVHYLTVVGKYEVKEASTNYSIGEADFKGLTQDNTAIEPGIAYDCAYGDISDDLTNPVDVGMTRKGNLTMTIDPKMEKIRFAPMWEPYTYEFDLTTLDIEEGAGETPGNAEQSSTPITAATSPASEAPNPEDAAAPTFDPNSADGYGPHQELPPLCERFPGQYDCEGNPIPTDQCVGFGCSPEQDAQLAETEGDATARFWECMAAGGTEETCVQ